MIIASHKRENTVINMQTGWLSIPNNYIAIIFLHADL